MAKGHPVKGNNRAGQLRALFARGVLKSSGKGKTRKVLYAKGASKPDFSSTRAARVAAGERRLAAFAGRLASPIRRRLADEGRPLTAKYAGKDPVSGQPIKPGQPIRYAGGQAYASARTARRGTSGINTQVLGRLANVDALSSAQRVAILTIGEANEGKAANRRHAALFGGRPEAVRPADVGYIFRERMRKRTRFLKEKPGRA